MARTLMRQKPYTRAPNKRVRAAETGIAGPRPERYIPPRFRGDKKGFLTWAGKHQDAFLRRQANNAGDTALKPISAKQAWKRAGWGATTEGHNTEPGNGPRPIVVDNPYDTGWNQTMYGQTAGGGGGGGSEGGEFVYDAASGVPLAVQKFNYKWQNMTPKERRAWAERKGGQNDWGYFDQAGGTEWAENATPQQIAKAWRSVLGESGGATGTGGDILDNYRFSNRGPEAEARLVRQAQRAGLDPDALLKSLYEQEHPHAGMSQEERIGLIRGDSGGATPGAGGGVASTPTMTDAPMSVAAAVSGASVTPLSGAATQAAGGGASPSSLARPTTGEASPATGGQGGQSGQGGGQTYMPPTANAIAGNRALEDQLSAQLAQLGVAREQIPAEVNRILAQLQTDQTYGTQGVYADLGERGLTLPGAGGYLMQRDVAIPFGREYQDLALEASRRYADLAAQEGEAYLGYDQGFVENLLQQAAEIIATMPLSIASARPKTKKKKKNKNKGGR